MQIDAIISKMGGGKTYFCVKQMLEKFSHCRVIANFHVFGHKNFEYIDDDEISSIQKSDWDRFRDSIFFIDEVNKIFRSRQWKNNNLEFFTYIRKINCHVFLISQAFEQIDSQLRALVTLRYEISDYRWLPLFGKLFSYFRIYRIYQGKTIISGGLFFLGKYFSNYDTNETHGDSQKSNIPSFFEKYLFYIKIFSFLYFGYYFFYPHIIVKKNIDQKKIPAPVSRLVSFPVKAFTGSDFSIDGEHFFSASGCVFDVDRMLVQTSATLSIDGIYCLGKKFPLSVFKKKSSNLLLSSGLR